MKPTQDVRSKRLPGGKYAEHFCDKTPPLNLTEAAIESSRCYFCHDAPCIQACPTEIDIPSFIRKISTGNLKGAALDILSENIMGGTCARVCPVETLCESACVRNHQDEKPVAIGQLQRHATDYLFEKKIQPFKRAASTGKKIAVIGAGPAGLSCAHRLAVLGHDIDVYEAQPKAGGLNEYGLAAYKVIDDWAQKEILFITSIGGIKIHFGRALGQNLTLAELRKSHDAVFLGLGLSGVNSLGGGAAGKDFLPGEDLPNVIDAVEYISQLRQAADLASLPVGRRIVVIGAGNTAIDIAVQSKLLGAEEVTLVYRRGVESMSATWKERELAQKNGVVIKTWAKPSQIKGTKDGVTEIEFEKTCLDAGGKLVGTGEKFILACDQVFKAIGQKLEPEKWGDVFKNLEIASGRIVVDENRKTTLDGVYAGGDCINGGALTVTAVQDGKIAAHSIHKKLTGRDVPMTGDRSWLI